MPLKEEQPWLSLSTIKRWEPLAKQQGVSEVARSPRGFLTQFKRVNGNFADLPDEWRKKRSAFIARHGAQMSREQLYDKKGNPSRRHLALIMWAYSPDARTIARAKPEMDEKVVKRNGQFCVISDKSKRKFGCYDNKEDAEKRLKQIQFFGRQNASIERLHTLLTESTDQEVLSTLIEQEAQS